MLETFLVLGISRTKAGRKEYVPPPIAGQDNNTHVIVPDRDYPTVAKAMQIQSKLY